MLKPIKLLLVVCWGLLGQVACTPVESPAEIQPIESSGSSWLIQHAAVYDGTGGERRQVDVRIDKGLITDIGLLVALSGEQVWDATGYVLSPGFIDPHSHHDSKLMQRPAPASALAQGSTTIVSGLDGGSSKFGERFVSVADNIAHFEQHPAAINLAYFGPHNDYREQVMGADFKRPSSPQEIEAMKSLLSRDLDAGGLNSLHELHMPIIKVEQHDFY